MQTKRKTTRRQARDAVWEAQSKWVKSLPAQTGLPLSRIARDAGLADTTLTQHAKRGTLLGNGAIQAIVTTHGVPRPGEPSLPNVSYALREDGIPYVPPEPPDSISRAIEQLVGAREQATAWVITSDALALAKIKRGDILIVDQSAVEQNGDIVRAEIVEGPGVKTVFRIYQRPAILGASMDPIAIRPETVDDSRVRIVGVVTNMLRQRD